MIARHVWLVIAALGYLATVGLIVGLFLAGLAGLVFAFWKALFG